MKNLYILLFTVLFPVIMLSAQETGEDKQIYQNIAGYMLQSDQRLTIGGYAQIDYNQPIDKLNRRSGEMDIHRLVMLFGYKFSKKVSFITEIEYEHVKEVYIEQAFLDYKIVNNHALRAGLILIPMGIINEFHEPSTFNGVERPLIDTYISPTTWREIGAGATGIFPDISLRYQAYLVTGFKSYDGTAKLTGPSGLRNARQRGASSLTNAPDLTGRIDYYGLSGFNFGLSAYLGNSETSLYNGINKNDKMAIARADSSVVKVGMAGFDTRFRKKGFQAKGQLYLVSLTNTDQYNSFTSGTSGPNNLGSSMYGYYLEAGYDVLRLFSKSESELIPFLRYEQYDMHHRTTGMDDANPMLRVNSVTTGLTFMAAPGAAIKADYQLISRGRGSETSSTLNFGIGLFF